MFKRILKFFSFPKYNQYDFILTKSYRDSNGKLRGDLVFRIEHVLSESLLCSKGRFEIKIENGQKKLVYTFDHLQTLTKISYNNVQEKLSFHKANKLLNERVERVKK